jgi:predicted phosphoribosyltransferase
MSIQVTELQAIFENRHDAGKRLTAELKEYAGQSAVVLAIPNGGVPVAVEVASELKADLDVIICHKLTLSLSPEGSLGAVADNGVAIINEPALKRTGLHRQQIEHEIGNIKAEIKKQSLLYKTDRPLIRVGGRTVIIVDDGLASGFTTKAAIQSVRHRRPKEVIVAVPVAPVATIREIEKIADRVVTYATGLMLKFYISDFYRHWAEVSNDEVSRYLRQWRAPQR